MSWKPEMLVDGDWRGNALRFATQEEAAANAKDLFYRWTVPNDYRAVYSDDPVNYQWIDGKLKEVTHGASDDQSATPSA
jgi:hypothetical protein